MKDFITWLYVKYVFLPDLKKMQEAEDTIAEFQVQRVDKNWDRIERALYEKRFNVTH